MKISEITKVYSENKKIIKTILILSLCLIVVDQITKVIAQKYLENAPDIKIIPDALSLHFLRNEISHIHQYILYFILTIIIFPAVILHCISKSYSRIIIIGMAVLWSAVFSNNIVDAFTLGYIRDFINLHGIAVGNIADQYRTAGILMVIAGLIIKDEKKFNSKILVRLIAVIIAVLLITALFWRYLARYLAV